MAARTESGKKAGSTGSVDAVDKDRLIEELKGRNLILEKELQARQDYIRTYVEDVRRKNDELEGHIRERKLVEDALCDSEERIKAFLENSAVIAWMKGEDGRYVFISQNFEKRFNVRFEDWHGKSDFDLWPVEQAEEFRSNDLAVLKSGKAVEMVEEAQNPDGSVSWWLSSKFMFKDAPGKRFVGGLGVDITERKRAEESLRESERYLDNIFECIQEGISILDKDLNVIKVNHTMEKWYSDTLPLVGKKCYQAYHGRTRACADCPSLRAINEKTMQTGIVPYVNRSGVAGWMELYSFPFIDDRDNVVGVIEHVRDITGRKRLEEKLSGLASIVRSSDDAIIGKTLDEAITSWNAGAERIYGYTEAEAVGCRLDIIVPQDRMQELKGITEKIRNGERVEHHETVRVAKDGRSVDISISYSPVYDASGRVIGASSIARDITGHKQAEEQLKVTRDRLECSLKFTEALLSAIPTPVFYKDVEGRYLGCNRAFSELMGVTSDGIRGKTVGELWPDEFAGAYHNKDLELMKKQELQVYDFKILDKDGVERPVIYVKDVFRDENGQVAGIVGAFIDITGRKQAEKALSRSEYILSKAQQIAHVGNWALNLKTYELDWSDEGYRIFGYDPGEIQPSLELLLSRMHPDDRDLVKRSIDMAMNENKLYNIDYRIIMQDGSTKYVNSVADKLKRDANGGPEWLFGIHQDITKRKLVEEALKEAKAYAELYVDLMGHDINNMNQSAMGYLELALQKLEMDRKLRSDDKVLIETPMNALMNSSRLIENVRKLQRLMTQGVKTKPVDLQGLFQDINTMNFYKGDRDVTINIPAIPHYMVEANDLLRDVFSNLVTNAIKHSDDEKPLTINIQVEQDNENSPNYYRCVVEDNGPGIPDELKKKLFYRFHRGETKAFGKGLGLYLVRTLVESYHGKVWAEDRVPGDHTKGARFVVMLPAVK